VAVVRTVAARQLAPGDPQLTVSKSDDDLGGRYAGDVHQDDVASVGFAKVDRRREPGVLHLRRRRQERDQLIEVPLHDLEF
jgi:hypothetical protein